MTVISQKHIPIFLIAIAVIAALSSCSQPENTAESAPAYHGIPAINKNIENSNVSENTSTIATTVTPIITMPSAETQLEPMEEWMRTKENESNYSDINREWLYSWTANDIPDTKELREFSFHNDVTPPNLDLIHVDNLYKTIADIETRGDCSIAFIALDEGWGVSYNAKQPIYTASTIKAAFAYYILTETDTTFLNEYRRSLIENMIVASDNDAYEELQDYYYWDGAFCEWLARYGIEHNVYDVNGAYPDCSAANMAALWKDIALFIDTNSEDAVWLADLLGRTEISFMRDGLIDERISIVNKGGWINDVDVNSTSDCGIVVVDGDRRYLLCIMTGQPSGGDAVDSVGQIAHEMIAMVESVFEDEAEEIVVEEENFNVVKETNEIVLD